MPHSFIDKTAYPDQFDCIVRDEAKCISKRRDKLKDEGKSSRGCLNVERTGSRSPTLDVVALALSGGGIRSASFSLGVVQALQQHNAIERIDYLSTVSGGGYLGSSLMATLTKTKGQFVFGTLTRSPGTHLVDVKDTDAVAHLRNYSNYLIPRGGRDVVTAAAIITRGLIANTALVLPFILAFAAITIFCNPNRDSLGEPDFFGYGLSWLPVQNFGVTLLLVLAGIPMFFAWALVRSSLPKDKQSEFATWTPTFAATYLVIIAASFFIELQPFFVKGMFNIADKAPTNLADVVHWLAAIATPVAGAIAFFRQQISTLFKSVTSSSSKSAKTLVIGSQAAFWIAGAALPLVIWLGYLYLCYWGITSDGVSVCKAGTTFCGLEDHTPAWLIGSARIFINFFELICWRPRWIDCHPVASFYLIIGILLFVLSLFLRPNANSLHRLYRDRLSKAFLFDPTNYAARGQIDKGRDFRPLDTLRISELINPELFGPYHLINAALNVQGSDFANRRGRNADFFLFSPAYVGSPATGYAKTKTIENATSLDLATAMAISGAAFSSNMGSKSIRALTPTLALLNVRTGFWLSNPRRFVKTDQSPISARRNLRSSYWFLWAEISGRLYEDSDEVYVTDGGHIENLGIYELLRRRCRVIVAVDAEADPSMRFDSFITLQRYARIDLGVRINMPWNNIREQTLAWMGNGSDAKGSPSHGPHVAIGTIDYDGGQKGWLLYIKSSLSGDENDYVRDYARRYAAFPHETTGDQFFSEEQFEAYRALGFHIVSRLLYGQDKIQVHGNSQLVTFKDSDLNVSEIRRALLGPDLNGA